MASAATAVRRAPHGRRARAALPADGWRLRGVPRRTTGARAAGSSSCAPASARALVLRARASRAAPTLLTRVGATASATRTPAPRGLARGGCGVRARTTRHEPDAPPACRRPRARGFAARAARGARRSPDAAPTAVEVKGEQRSSRSPGGAGPTPGSRRRRAILHELAPPGAVTKLPQGFGFLLVAAACCSWPWWWSASSVEARRSRSTALS